MSLRDKVIKAFHEDDDHEEVIKLLSLHPKSIILIVTYGDCCVVSIVEMQSGSFDLAVTDFSNIYSDFAYSTKHHTITRESLELAHSVLGFVLE